MSALEVEAKKCRLKKDWEDIGNRARTSEAGLDMDRAALIRRYREEEGLTQDQIGEALGMNQAQVSRILRYTRFVTSMPDRHTRITEVKFRAYWSQVADAKKTKGKREPDLAYEALCFADIRKLVEFGTPPHRPGKRKPEAKPGDIKTIRQMGREVQRIYNGQLKSELRRIIRLFGTDRSAYAPDLLSNAARAIKRDVCRIIKLLLPDEKDLPEHEEPAAANSGK